MKRIAFFLEGQTECLFVERLLTEIAGEHQITVVSRQASGSRGRRTIQLAAVTGTPYFALLVDCGADNTVASDIRDYYNSLVAGGYTSIVGLRDVYPTARGDIPELQKQLYYKMRTVPVRPEVILAVMEVEAWFLADPGHLYRLLPGLTATQVLTQLQLDLATLAVETLDAPAATLDAIYRLVGRRYTKQRARVQRLVKRLDFAELYFSARGRVPSFGSLVTLIDDFLA